jgi:DNA-directed RNA polymerase specialized sigma subunit
MLDVPEELVRYLARLLAAERRCRRTPARSRKLSCRQQAVMALRWFRDRTRIEALGRDHGVSRATAYRYVAEAVDVLSAQAPGLGEALERALADGWRT